MPPTCSPGCWRAASWRARAPRGSCCDRVEDALAGVADEAALGGALRRLRRREMVRIAWRDLAGWADLDEVLAELTALAEGCLEAALGRLEAWQREAWGVPRGPDGEAQSLVVLGMGKLGAGELNFSSDIDLIFAYPEEGETDQGRSNAEFFTRLGQRLVSLLSELTGEGFVFRVDLRLRPYGDGGPVAASFDALEEYYQAQGREWERYAMIKARPVAGDREAGARLMELLRPFVYRRYLDFGAYASLREMKAMIAQQVERKGLAENIKLGAGGIREIEFIGQAFQLVRGGREPELRARGIVTVLERLGARGCLPGYVVEQLIDAYRFLRRVENRLQARADRQTHALPAEAHERLGLAYAMGFEEWTAFDKVCTRHRQRVRNHFEQVVSAPQTEEEDEGRGGPDLAGVWLGALADEAAAAALEEAGFDDPAEALRLVRALRDAHAYRALSARGRERLDRLMPMVLGAVAGAERPSGTLLRVTGLIEAIARRTTYIDLLAENPMALSQLVKLCAASPWIAGFLRQHPLLLDELLDPLTLYAPLRRESLERELGELLDGVGADDLEEQMEALRQFKQANTLRVAAADIANAIPLMEVSDHLTEIAEVVLERVLALAGAHLAARHGWPECEDAGTRVDAGFAVVGYGKLGGIELGYGSDLDLVFIYDCPGEERPGDGPKPLDHGVFFARLAQRVIHMLTARTPSGILYEVDPRLRPSGSAGLLVSTLEAFAEYQREEAWTWEHQALVRARVVAGDAALAERFAAVRCEVLTRERDPERLREEVREMRERMRRELGGRGKGGFDLKQDPGGITDIEFVVQYGALAWAHDHPELIRYTDNIRLLEGLAQAGLLPEPDVKLLADAYRAYRKRRHRLTLEERPGRVRDEEFAELREGVRRVWARVIEGRAPDRD